MWFLQGPAGEVFLMSEGPTGDVVLAGSCGGGVSYVPAGRRCRMGAPGVRSYERVAPHPAPCTLHPAPCTLHPAPCTLHPAPCTLHPAPWPLYLLGGDIGWELLACVARRLRASAPDTKTSLLFLSFLLSRIEWSDRTIYEPYIRALLGTAPHF